jgi:hypothetical protein
MATAGRQCVLDEKKKSRILAFLKSGCSRATAASAIGCDPKTIPNTAKRDPEFAKKLVLAEAASELVHLDNINKAAKELKYWRASAWMLERIHPDRYAKASPDAVPPAQMTDIIVDIAEIIVQEIPIAKFRKQILKRFNQLLIEAQLFADHPPNPAPRLPSPEPTPIATEPDNHEAV